MPFVNNDSITIKDYLESLSSHIEEVSGSSLKDGYLSNIIGSENTSNVINSNVTGVSARLFLDTFNNLNVFGSSYRGRRFRGTVDYPSGILKDDVLLQLVGDGYSESGNMENATSSVVFRAAENFRSGKHGTYIEIYTTPSETKNQIKRLHISQDGKIGVNNYDPQYTLDVSGAGNFTNLYLNGLPVSTGGGGPAQVDLNGYIKTGDCDIRYMSNNSSGAFYLASNPNNYVTNSIINGLSTNQNVENTGSILDNKINSLSGSITVGGEVNTASNIGEGVGIFAQKNGVDLQFYELVGGSGISVSQSGNNIRIDSKNDFTSAYLTSNRVMATANVWYDILTGTLSPGLWSIDANVTFFRPSTTLGTNTVKLWTNGVTGASTSVSFPSQANNFTSANISAVRNVSVTENWVLSCAGGITNNQVSCTGWTNAGLNATSLQAIKFR